MEERIEDGKKKMEDDETVALLGPAPAARRSGKERRRCCRLMLLSALLAVAVICAVVIATPFIIGNSSFVAKMGNETSSSDSGSSYGISLLSLKTYLTHALDKLRKKYSASD